MGPRSGKERPISRRPELRRPFAGGPRGLALVGLVALLLAVAAWAAPGVTSGRAGVDATATAPSGADRVLTTFIAAAWGAGAVLMVFVARALVRRPDDEDEEEAENEATVRAWWLPWLAMLIIVTTLVIPVLLIWATRTHADQQPGGSSGSAATRLPGTPHPSVIPSAWSLLAIVAGGAGAWYVLFRRAPRVDEDRVAWPEVLVKAVDDSIHDIEEDPDARRAIIRAYARMEGVLARSGVPRRPSQTPLEYIEGALRQLLVPAAPVRSLTELFEIARFSDRPMDASMKRRAIDCLLEVRFALVAEEVA